MTETRYRAMLGWFERRPAARRALALAARGLTALVYIAYAALEAWLLLRRDSRLPRATWVPALVFVSGSILRRAINAPRPYEVYRHAPLVAKQTKGCSFPSRHVFCAGVIAMAFGWIYPPLGWAMGAVAAGIALTRVLTGVHFMRDVLAGLAFGFGLGLAGFFLLPHVGL